MSSTEILRPGHVVTVFNPDSHDPSLPGGGVRLEDVALVATNGSVFPTRVPVGQKFQICASATGSLGPRWRKIIFQPEPHPLNSQKIGLAHRQLG